MNLASKFRKTFSSTQNCIFKNQHTRLIFIMTTVENYFTNIESYQRIVSSNYNRYLDMISDYNNFSNGKDFFNVDEETQNFLYAVRKSMDETAMVIIAFSQMTDESFCNAYLIKS